MINIKFSKGEITNGFKALVEKFSKLSIFIEILDGFYSDFFIITKKTLPLSHVLGELTAHIYGQLEILIFDRASKKYKTLSVSEIYFQISNEFTTNEAAIHQADFDAIRATLDELKDTEKKLKLYRDKYYAHTEFRVPEDVQKDYENFNMSWHEAKNLVYQAKNMLNVMSSYCGNMPSDFEKKHCAEFKNGFWDLINLPKGKTPLKDWM